MRISKEAKIGIISIIVLAVALWGFHFLKGKNILTPSDEYFVKFDSIPGIIESGTVYMKGYKIGNITNIKFDHKKSGKFILRIIIDDGIRIPMNSRVRPKQSSLLASASDLEILESNSKIYYKPGDTLLSVPPEGLMSDLAPIEAKYNHVMNGLDSTLKSINDVFTPETKANLKSSISKLNKTLTGLSNSLSPNGNLKKSFDNLESITANLKAKNKEIASLMDHLDHISASLDSADLKISLLKLDSTLGSTRDILAKVNEGKGTLGKMVNDSSLYIHLDSTVYQLDNLLKNLQEHPKRYVHFSVFGKKDK